MFVFSIINIIVSSIAFYRHHNTYIYIYYTVAAHLTFYAVITIFTNVNT